MEYQIMFYGGLAGAVITLIISIIVFIKLQISQVLTDLTGVTFRKKPENVRTKIGKREGTETKRTTSEIKLRKKEVPVAAAMEDTELMSQEVDPTALLEREDMYVAPTALLSERNHSEEETSLLSEDDETTLLTGEDDETTILSEGDGETAILTEVEEKSDFIIEVDVMVIHTNQIIEQKGVLK